MEQLHQPSEPREALIQRLVQQVMGETIYNPSPHDIEDAVWDYLAELEETNGLPEGVSAYDCYTRYTVERISNEPR